MADEKRLISEEEENLLKKSEKQSNDFKNKLRKLSDDMKNQTKDPENGKTDTPPDE